MARVRVGVVGFGSVSRNLVLELAHRPMFSARIEVAYILSSRGGVRSGLEEAVRLAEAGLRLDGHPGFEEGLCYRDMLGEVDLAFIAIPPSYKDGEPNLTMYRELLGGGVSVITADKTGLALRYSELVGLARSRGVFLGYRATVAAGIPAVDSARGLRGRGVEEVRAVLNATTNYILGLVEKGMGFEEAVEKAIEMRLAEPDPRIDTEGWDPAAKIAILSSTLGYEASIMDVERRPLSELSGEEVREAPRRGLRAKYLAEAKLSQGILRVYPALIPADDPLANTPSNHNTLVFRLEGEEIVLRGPVGPAWRTAKAMITDLLDYLDIHG